MSVRDIPLRKVLQLFDAPPALRRAILREDIRLDRKREAGGTRSKGGDFYLPFWSDVKKHVADGADLFEMTKGRIASNKNFSRLYPLLRDGVIELLGAKLRWTNEPIQIAPKSIHGNLELGDIGAIVRVRDALHARVRSDYTRVVYPYFSEDPILSEEGGRLGLWAMQQSLTEANPDDMRIIDILRKSFFSPQVTPLRGNEAELFRTKYKLLISEWENLKSS